MEKLWLLHKHRHGDMHEKALGSTLYLHLPLATSPRWGPESLGLLQHQYLQNGAVCPLFSLEHCELHFAR